MRMTEAPKSILVDEAWAIAFDFDVQLAVTEDESDAVRYVRADIAEGYREALVRIHYVRADIAEGYRALNSEMLEALRSAYQFMLTSPAQRSVQALQDVQDAIGKADALAKGDEV